MSSMSDDNATVFDGSDLWVFCKRCYNERKIKLCKKRQLGGGYEMKAGDRRAVIFAGYIVCPRCSMEQPIPPAPSAFLPAEKAKPASPKKAAQNQVKEAANAHE